LSFCPLVLAQKREHRLIECLGGFGRHGVGASANDNPLAVGQANLQLVDNQMEEFWTAVTIGQERGGIDRLRHVAGEDRSWAFRRRVGLIRRCVCA